MKRLLVLLFVMLACPTIAAAQDVCAPSKINNLSATYGKTTVVLEWNHSGDDCNTGTATSYEIRQSTSNITDINWQLASVAATGATTGGNGTPACRGIADLTCNTTYYFVVFLIDDAGNRSPLGNVVQVTTAGCGTQTEVDC